MAAAVFPPALHVANVGDSRVYLGSGQITQLTRDHTVTRPRLIRGRSRENAKLDQNATWSRAPMGTRAEVRRIFPPIR